jgi:hypothetical protein
VRELNYNDNNLKSKKIYKLNEGKYELLGTMDKDDIPSMVEYSMGRPSGTTYTMEFIKTDGGLGLLSLKDIKGYYIEKDPQGGNKPKKSKRSYARTKQTRSKKVRKSRRKRKN